MGPWKEAGRYLDRAQKNTRSSPEAPYIFVLVSKRRNHLSVIAEAWE